MLLLSWIKLVLINDYFSLETTFNFLIVNFEPTLQFISGLAVASTYCIILEEHRLDTYILECGYYLVHASVLSVKFGWFQLFHLTKGDFFWAYDYA